MASGKWDWKGGGNGCWKAGWELRGAPGTKVKSTHTHKARVPSKTRELDSLESTFSVGRVIFDWNRVSHSSHPHPIYLFGKFLRPSKALGILLHLTAKKVASCCFWPTANPKPNGSAFTQFLLRTGTRQTAPTKWNKSAALPLAKIQPGEIKVISEKGFSFWPTPVHSWGQCNNNGNG